MLPDTYPDTYIVKPQKRKSISATYNALGDLIIKTPLGYPTKKIDYFIENNVVALWHLKQKLKQKISLNKDIFNQSFEKFKAINIIKQRFDIIYPKAEKLDLIISNEPFFKIMASKWGYCKSNKTICFNIFLGLLPIELIDCVVSHELCHLKEMNHSKKFYDLLQKLYPDYKKCDQELKQYILS